MAKKPVTIYDISREANVGVGTVSRVLNNHPNVSKKTRARVQDVIDRLGYRPQFPARYIRTKQSKTLGFISDQVATTPFAVSVIKGALDRARKDERVMLIMDADASLHNREDLVDLMLERNVEGLLYAAMFHQSVELPPAYSELATVLVDCYSEARDFPSIVPDEVSGGYIATRHLIERGHHRIGIILPDALDSGFPASPGRFAGYKKALAEAGLPLQDELVLVGDYTADSGYVCMRKLLDLADRPTAVFCGTDRIAMGAYDAIKMLGLRIPDDVAIVGFDNLEIIAAYLRPALTSVALPHYEMGWWAADYLLQHLNGQPFKPVQKSLACPLISRDSV